MSLVGRSFGPPYQILEESTTGKSSSARLCIVNLGHFRTGTTTLATAAEALGLRVHRKFSELASSNACRDFLVHPMETVEAWWYTEDGATKFLRTIENYDLICDGWSAMLIFLPPQDLLSLGQRAHEQNVNLVFIATMRHIEFIVPSELHHWIRHDLVQRAALSVEDQCNLEDLLRKRAKCHYDRLISFSEQSNVVYPNKILHLLPLDEVNTSWSSTLASLYVDRFSETLWTKALNIAGIQNCNPPLPIQGILLTVRIGSGDQSIKDIQSLLTSIEKDPLCEYILILALDHDEADKEEAKKLIHSIQSRTRMKALDVIVNPPRDSRSPFPICQVWDQMAKKAWTLGASWVVLLGDDVRIHSNFHYREIYSSFLKISESLHCPFGFGCPWLNDLTFPGFPTFPVIGKVHYEIFGGLIPKQRMDAFFNQDLDPYLHRLYLKFGASPLLLNAHLSNNTGGNDGSEARYKRISAAGWRDWVLDDVEPIERYLKSHSTRHVEPRILLDVIVPTYRLNLSYLERICALNVPDRLRTTFIIIVDNPALLIQRMEDIVKTKYPNDRKHALILASGDLENFLSEKANPSAARPGNNIRVRCNPENLGASASRNRGLGESSAEYVLFLDDDVLPEYNLLEAYQQHLTSLLRADSNEESTLVGLVGMVNFPRSPTLPLKHAAILMSYLTYMFEIVADSRFQNPAWGVTANILVKRCPGLCFDTDYAKSGGGEDIDFCLRLLESGGYLKAAPDAIVHHPFWNGSILEISMHFFNWARGDSALFSRFPHHCYRSFPNIVETLMFMLPFSYGQPQQFLLAAACLFVSDVIVDMCDFKEFSHRCHVVGHPRPLWFSVFAHFLANFYVNILEAGRLLGHLRRCQFFNITKRFDWHCGKLMNSRSNFRHKEGRKFAVFIAFAAFITRNK